MDTKYIIKEYFDNERSIIDLAEEFNTYPNKIRRIILKTGKTLRSKSESQKIALNSGRVDHPTKGKQRSKETKRKLSNTSAENWKNLSKADKDARKKKLSDAWRKRDPEDIKDMQKKAAIAISNAGRKGSKLENFLLENLPKRGYSVLAHQKGLIKNADLEPDLIIAGTKILIEIDGPSHFFPVYGQDKLNKTIAADSEKNALFLQEGYCVLRVKHLCKTLTEFKKRKALVEIVEALEKIKNNHQVTIIDIEV